VLEGADIKLRAVVSNVVGASCRVMLDVLLRGEVDAEAMAVLARGRLRKKHAQAALGGSNGAYQRQLGSSRGTETSWRARSPCWTR
jgi:transposase